MSVKAVAWALEQNPASPAAKLILISIANHFNESRGYAWPSMETLAKCALCSVRTARRHLRELEKDGFIQSEAQFNEGRKFQTSNRYFIPQICQKPLETKPGQNDRPCKPSPDKAVTALPGQSCDRPARTKLCPGNSYKNQKKNSYQGEDFDSEKDTLADRSKIKAEIRRTAYSRPTPKPRPVKKPIEPVREPLATPEQVKELAKMLRGVRMG